MIEKVKAALLESPENYYHFLTSLANQVEPKLSIELGTNQGESAFALHVGHQDGFVMSFDIVDYIHSVYRANNIGFFNKDSVEASKFIGDGSVDILFVDALHDGKSPLAEFYAWRKKLAEDCVVLFDDVGSNESMSEFWDSFNPHGFIKVPNSLHITEGFGIIVRE